MEDVEAAARTRQPVRFLTTTGLPPGITPGQPFQVQTPGGPMQVTCPPGTKEGMPMLVNVPATPQQPVVVQAQTVMGQPVSTAPVPFMQARSTAPVPFMQARTALRIDEMRNVKNGCFVQPEAPCCNAYYFCISHDGQSLTIGPGICCCICCCPFPGGCGTPQSANDGTAHYVNAAWHDHWESADRIHRFGPGIPPAGLVMTRVC